MDKVTKQIAVDKAQSLLFKVGYPEFIVDVDKLDDYYAQVYEIIQGKFHLSNRGLSFTVLDR